MSKKEEIREENRKIRYLRFLVDFSLNYIARSDISPEDAQNLVERVKKQAVILFPGKEDTFEIIYRPRFQRLITQKFRFH
jgi:hypothetical protein